VYQESNQSKIRGCVSLEEVEQYHKHGDHYVIVKEHVKLMMFVMTVVVVSMSFQWTNA
jgi:hypothetical protein